MPGFDTKKYLKIQRRAIEERLSKFSGRLYFEFGGKLIGDFHAARTLPGYDPDAKLLLLKSLRKDLGVVYCVSAKQLASRKMRGDYRIGYDLATIKALEDLRQAEIPLIGVVINRFDGEQEAEIFEKKLKRMKVAVFKRWEIHHYPEDIDLVLSREGFGSDDHIKTEKPLVVVWGAGPGSGKLSTCLGQVYLDAQDGINSGYAKFETFPIWDLPLEHSVNIAYEAAAADLGDFNLIDTFHYQAYRKIAVNYNRDVEAFPIISKIFSQVLKKSNFARHYRSPTDMGVNLLKQGIVDDRVVSKAAKREIAFYLFRYRQEYKEGLTDEKTLERMANIMNRAGVTEEYLPTVKVARWAKIEAQNKKGKGDGEVYCGSAIELPNGQVISGKNSPLLFSESAATLNAIKTLAGIPNNLDLISPMIIRQINRLKKQIGQKSASLDGTETLLALAVSTKMNPLAKKAIKFLDRLRGCFMHSTHRLSAADEKTFRKLGIWISTDGETAGL